MSVSSKLKKQGARIRRHVSSSPSKSTKSTSISQSINRKNSSIAIDPSSNPSLTAFEIKKEITSKQLQGEQISALTVAQNFIYLATKSGKLSIFEEKPNSNSNRSSMANKSSMTNQQRSHVKHKKTQVRTSYPCTMQLVKS